MASASVEAEEVKIVRVWLRGRCGGSAHRFFVGAMVAAVVSSISKAVM